MAGNFGSFAFGVGGDLGGQLFDVDLGQKVRFCLLSWAELVTGKRARTFRPAELTRLYSWAASSGSWPSFILLT